MQYAKDAGVDYFAFVWYPTEGSKNHKQASFSDCSHKVFELNYARGLYQKASLRKGLVRVQFLARGFTKKEIKMPEFKIRHIFRACESARQILLK